MKPKDYYEVLGVSKTATDAELKSAYRKKALEWHPDRNKTPEAEAKFKEINQAYEVLGNKEKRAQYDQFGHAGPGGQNPFGGYSGGFGGQGVNINFEDLFGGAGGFSDPMDIFENFFGGASPFGRAKQKVHYQMKIDFLESIKGVTKEMVHQGKKYSIKIPAGANSGTTIRYADFDLSVIVSPHPQFKREGNDVIVDLPISFTTAILGGDIKVPTLEGDQKLKIKSGTQPNSLIRLTGKGAPIINSSHRGDLYIRFVVEVPTKISRQQKQLLEEFENA